MEVPLYYIILTCYLYCRYFIAVSYDQTSIEIYDFKGSEAGGRLTTDVKGDLVPGTDGTDSCSTHVRGKIFSQFLDRRHIVRVTSGEETLNR